MTANEGSSEEKLIVAELDPYWVNYGRNIRELVKLISSSHTQAGEKELKSFWDYPEIRNYPPVHSIIGMWIALVEYEEIGKKEGRDYFSGPINQIITLKAFKFSIESEIKTEFYDDLYKSFFEGILKRLNQLEEQIKEGTKLQNFLNSLGMIVSQEVENLIGRGVFDMRMDKIRGEIREYLSELIELDGGQIFSEIQKGIESVLI
jgi:hypothetical protein